MPAKVVSVATMNIGKKGGGKHWTQAEVEARKAAAEGLKRSTSKKISPPGWLSAEARKVWQRKINEVVGLNAAEDLLDVLDSEMLAIYCDAYVQYYRVAKLRQKSVDDIKELQAWARIVSVYAEKLGFNPSARARLVKKRADKKSKDEFGNKFD